MKTAGQVPTLGALDRDIATPAARTPSVACRDKRRASAAGFLGRHLLLVGLTPAGVFGIAVGATTVVLKLGDSTIHLSGIAIVWGAATIVSVVSIFSGMREAAVLSRSTPLTGPLAETTISPVLNEVQDSVGFPKLPPRYQTLKSINPEN